MSKKIASRTAQWPLVAEFSINFDDTMVNSVGNTVDFGKTNLGGAAGIFSVIPLPPGAVVIGGELVTETAFDTAGLDVTIGDANVANRYLASTDVKGAARVALVPTGYRGIGENIVLSFSSDDACTAGTLTLRVQYIVTGRTSEVQIT
jgi:formylmethanofuran dehydrogenase subunit C